MARALGKMGDYVKYIKRSRGWKNMYKADQRSVVNGVDTNYTGFMQPRYANGTWGYQDPAHCSPVLEFEQCYLNADGGETYEGSPWLYTFFAPHDMASLIATLGGRDAFVSRLDYFHDSGIAYVGDEQAFLPVYQYHYAGRPGLSSKRAHYYIPSFFNATTGGLPGNDDSGAMGSFQVLSMLGLWPVAGQDVYLINPPFFAEVNITSPVTGRTATIRNINHDAGYARLYIQSATLDGKAWTRNWIDHSFFLEGRTLELVLGEEESDWGTRQEDCPPSLSTGGFGESAVGGGGARVFF
ncbi:hypothetical protein KEM55_006841 [Ascosphaera atra]|nr:hypothetical protein KEM55_006841 [Ascosphaera atra]